MFHLNCSGTAENISVSYLPDPLERKMHLLDEEKRSEKKPEDKEVGWVLCVSDIKHCKEIGGFPVNTHHTPSIWGSDGLHLRTCKLGNVWRQHFHFQLSFKRLRKPDLETCDLILWEVSGENCNWVITFLFQNSLEKDGKWNLHLQLLYSLYAKTFL